jgi:hypothetical protein
LTITGTEQCLLVCADGFTVNYPPLCPDVPIHRGEEGVLFELIAQLGAKDYRQRFFRYEEVWACGTPRGQRPFGAENLLMRQQRLLGKAVDSLSLDARADTAWQHDELAIR